MDRSDAGDDAHGEDRGGPLWTRSVTRRPILKAAGVVAGATAIHAGLAARPPRAAAAGHPAMLHTEADFARMRQKVQAAEQPWRGAWDRLVASRNSQSSWTPRPAATINRGTSPDNTSLLYNDAAAIYQNALRWKISGDVAHADKAVEILDAWGSTLTAITGNADRFLAAGLHGYQLANGAEIMRTYSGWDRAGVARFQQMMLDVFYPMNHDFLVRHNGAHVENYWANWDLCTMASILAIGILCDDQAKIDEAVEYFRTGAGQGAIHHAVPILHSPTLGQWQESGRDQAHTLMGVGLMASICEMAWNQGIDLYGYADRRFLAGAEYVARYNNGSEVPFAYYSRRSGTNGAPNTFSVVADSGRGGSRTIWDTIVGHYAHRLGLHIPEVEQAATATRPDGGPAYGMHASAFDHLGFTTLTHYRGPVATKVTAGVYLVTARHSGQAVARRDNGTSNGTRLEQRPIGDPQLADLWVVEEVGSGRYRILDATSGRSVDIPRGSTANGAKVQLWDYWGGENELFTLSPTADGHFRVTPVHSGKCIAVGGASSAEGAGLIQWQFLGGSEQQWRFTAGSTVRRLRLASTTNQYLRHSAYRAQLAPDPYPAQDSEFRVVLGLAGLTGVTFESVNFPGRYLRVRLNGEVGIDGPDGSDGFAASATFRRVAGLADPTAHSYQTWGDPTRYLARQSSLINAVPVPGAAAAADATFAEVVAAPGY